MLLIHRNNKWETITGEQKKELPEEERSKVIALNDRLKAKLDFAKRRMKNNWDVCVVVDGKVGSGKSTLAKIIGWYVSDSKLKIDNLCSGADDFIEKLGSFEKGSVIILDEGSLALSSTDFMKKEFKRIVKILDVCRQMNFFLIIVAPSIFNLTKYIAVDRSNFLVHVYEKGGTRGTAMYFGDKKKAQLYQLGKRNFGSYDKPKANFKFKFANFEPFPEYQELKKESLFKSLAQDREDAMDSEQKALLNVVLNLVEEGKNKTDIARIIGKSRRTVYNYLEYHKKRQENGGNVVNNN